MPSLSGSPPLIAVRVPPLTAVRVLPLLRRRRCQGPAPPSSSSLSGSRPSFIVVAVRVPPFLHRRCQGLPTVALVDSLPLPLLLPLLCHLYLPSPSTVSLVIITVRVFPSILIVSIIVTARTFRLILILINVLILSTIPPLLFLLLFLHIL